MEAIDKVESHIADAVKRGAKDITGGKRHALGGSFFEPTVLSEVGPDALVAHEEIFGPLAPVIRFKDEADVISMCNNSPFGVASYFYSRDVGRVWRMAEAHSKRLDNDENDDGDRARYGHYRCVAQACRYRRLVCSRQPAKRS
jgi:acyl-CoA reductase-like NAD-dependent aldehyde dehydrogenase